MLNILMSVVLLCVSVVGFFLTAKINRVEQVFYAVDSDMISHCIELDIANDKYFFVKKEVVETFTYYFENNLDGYDYDLIFYFREDEGNVKFSNTPNIVQIDIKAKIIFDGTYKKNVRFSLSGREVSKDWWTTF